MEQPWIQPYELDEILFSSGKWLNDNYNVVNHNCHDFVKECLKYAEQMKE